MEDVEQKAIYDDKIDLIQLGRSVWAKRIFIAKVTAVFIVIGLVIAFASPVEYQASSKLLPESDKSKSSSLGGLAGLAGLAGVDLGSISGPSVLTPQLYPEIVNSLPFVLEAINDTIYFEQKDIKTTSLYYFKEIRSKSFLKSVGKYTIGLPGLLKKAIVGEKEELPNNSEFIRISKEDWKLYEQFKERISVSIDDETGIIEIWVKMPDPYAAAQLTKKIEIMITEAVIKYKTDKSLKNLKFIQNAYREAKTKFENIQLELARTKDRNKNVTLASAEIEVKKMEYEYDVAFNVYKGLSTQVEQAKIQLKEETPVFTVLESPRIPEDKSSPKRKMILIVSLFLGAILSVAWVVLKKVIQDTWA